MPNLTDFVHIFSKRGYLQCVFVHWRDLKTKSKSTALWSAYVYLLENWNSSTTAPDAQFSPWWASTASSHSLCCSSWSCFHCAAALSACTLPAYPRLEITLFASRGLLMSAQHCLQVVFVLGFQSWPVDSQGDKSKLRSIGSRYTGERHLATQRNNKRNQGSAPDVWSTSRNWLADPAMSMSRATDSRTRPCRCPAQCFSFPESNERRGISREFMRSIGPYASLAAMFWTVSAILIVLSTVVAKDAVSSVHVQSDSECILFEIVSLLGWLKTCPEDLAKHTGAFLLMAVGWASFFLSSKLASKAHLPSRASWSSGRKRKPDDRRRDSMMLGARVLQQ